MGSLTKMVSDWFSATGTPLELSSFWLGPASAATNTSSTATTSAASFVVACRDAGPFVLCDEEAFFVSLDKWVFWEGSLGRDFLIGFLARTGEGPLAGLFGGTFSSKLNRPDRKLRGLFASVSRVGEFLFRPSLGDFALVVGIYIIIITS